MARAIAALAAGACSRRDRVRARADRGAAARRRGRAAGALPSASSRRSRRTVSGDTVERRAQLGGDDLAVALQPLEDHLAPFLGEHVLIQA